MKTVDLDYEPFFEVYSDSLVEIFIDGKSRVGFNPHGWSRVYVLCFPAPECGDEDEDKLSF